MFLDRMRAPQSLPLYREKSPQRPPSTSRDEVTEDKGQGRALPPPPLFSRQPAPDPAWVMFKLEKASQDDRRRNTTRSIYRVPKPMREANEEAYTPQLVSLGPYHRGRPSLAVMEQHKWRALRQMITRSRRDFNFYFNAVSELEEELRGCYDGDIDLSSNDFVLTMLVDGCFVLEIFCGLFTCGFVELGYPYYDPVFSRHVTAAQYAYRDMILLENQIPLFLLDLLFCLQRGSRRRPDPHGPEEGLHWLDISRKSAGCSIQPIRGLGNGNRSRSGLGGGSESSSSLDDGDVDGDGSPNHSLGVLQLCRRFGWCRPTLKAEDKKPQRPQTLTPSVTQLRKARIKIKRRMEEERYWDVRFESDIIWIPRIVVGDSTKTLLLNLMAYEQCHPECSSEITSYVTFMDDLIETEEDVAHLQRRGIIEHCLGSTSEVATLFNCLRKEVIFDRKRSHLKKMSDRLNEHYNRRLNVWTNLKNDYCYSPWATASVVAATVLLLLTLVQTIYAILQYHARA